MKHAVFVRLDPGDIVAHGPDLPAFEAGGRNQHGEVRLTAGAGECGGDIALFAGRIFDAEDEHVLRHPAIVARHVACDAQGETFLAEERVATIAGPVRPNLARFGKVHDVLFRVAGPRDIGLTVGERRAKGVHAGDDALQIFIDFAEDGQANARHDAHVDHNVWRIG